VRGNLAEDGDHFAVEVVLDGEHEAVDTGGFEVLDLLGGGSGGTYDPGVGVAHVGARAFEEEFAALDDLLVSGGDAETGEDGETEGGGVAADLFASEVEADADFAALRWGGEGDDEFLGVLGGETNEANGGGTATDEDGEVGALHRRGGEVAVLEVVVGAVEGERVLDPESFDNLELLFDEIDAFGGGAEGEPVGVVLGFEPTGADTELGTAIRHVVEGGGHFGEDGGVAESDGTDETAETDALGVAGETTEEDPGIGGHAVHVAGGGIVVFGEEGRMEPGVFGGTGHRQGVGIGHAFLDFDRQTEFHGEWSPLGGVVPRSD
jgi:hypothetical protein